MYNHKLVFPGVDTCFLGVNEERGLYSERCQACGRCILAETGGICPITRCSKAHAQRSLRRLRQGQVRGQPGHPLRLGVDLRAP